jgi:hypothetical protein
MLRPMRDVIEIGSDAERQALASARESARGRPPAAPIQTGESPERQAMTDAREGADRLPPAAPIPGKSGGRRASSCPRESAISCAPAVTDTGATAPGQASPTTRESAMPLAPAEHPRAVEDAPKAESQARGAGEAVPSEDAGNGPEVPDRFADPLIAEIVEIWRLRQDMVKAQQKLTLQGKAICRRFTDGDKVAAEKLWKAIIAGEDHPPMCGAAVTPMLAAMEPLIAQRAAFEKRLARLGKALPFATFADRVKGVNHMTLATMVGELGDPAAYAKGVAGLWKRAGLAVIDGERQRKKAGDAALLHGYSPSRRSVFWNIGAALLKAQGTGEDAGPYRLIYDRRKALELARVEKAHAHNRAMRHMTKALLRDLWRAAKEGS